MRVALFTDSDAFSGTERHILDLASYLQAYDIQATITCPPDTPLARKAQEEAVPVVEIAKRGLIDLQAITALRGIMRRRQVDLIHAHNGRTALNLALAARAEGGFPCVATQHFLSPEHTLRRGLVAMAHRRAHLWVNSQLRGLFAISHAVREEMLSRGDAASPKITTIHNGVRVPDRNSLTDPMRLRRELQVSVDTPLVVCAARLEPEKDIGTLVEAMGVVREVHPNIVCLIAGEGSLRAELQKMVAARGLEKVVRFLGFRSDVLSLINASDLFVLPSVAEPFGLAIIEAMALSKPVIATRVGGPCEIVVDGHTGHLVPPTHPRELAAAIRSVFGDIERLRDLGRCGAERFGSLFTAERMARDTATAYREVLCRPC